MLPISSALREDIPITSDQHLPARSHCGLFVHFINSMKLFLASICAVTCLSGEPARAQYYPDPYYGQDPTAEIEDRLHAIERRQADLQWQIDEQFNQTQVIYQEGF